MNVRIDKPRHDDKIANINRRLSVAMRTVWINGGNSLAFDNEIARGSFFGKMNACGTEDEVHGCAEIRYAVPQT